MRARARVFVCPNDTVMVIILHNITRDFCSYIITTNDPSPSSVYPHSSEPVQVS